MLENVMKSLQAAHIQFRPGRLCTLTYTCNHSFTVTNCVTESISSSTHSAHIWSALEVNVHLSRIQLNTSNLQI